MNQVRHHILYTTIMNIKHWIVNIKLYRIYAFVIKNHRSVYNIHETSLLLIFCLLITEEEIFIC